MEGEAEGRMGVCEDDRGVDFGIECLAAIASIKRWRCGVGQNWKSGITGASFEKALR